jgi:site-specific DNA-methyltransferase (adenine-specific)
MELVNNDCLEYMKTLPNKSVDLFLCDLPYGCLSNNRVAKRVGELKDKEDPNSNIVVENRPCAWDVKIDLEKFWTEVKRLMKNDHTPIIHFCNTRFGNELINSNPTWFRYDLVWEKTNPVGFLSANKMPLRSHENIYVFAKKGATYYRKDIEGDFKGQSSGKGRAGGDVYSLHKRSETSNTYPKLKDSQATREGIRCVKTVFEFANKKGKGNHPTAKPLDLYKFLIERYSKEGDTILDPTAGSFASGVAAKELNRKYIGIELSKDFYEKGRDLLNK